MSAIKAMFDSFLNWLRSLFFKQEMELTLVGLNGAGKTTLIGVIATNEYVEDLIPTVGFNMRKVSKGKVSIKMWDLGGQARFRSMWERYCRNVHAIVFVVDSADSDRFGEARDQIHDLFSKPSLAGIPTLVLGSKNDLPGCLNAEEMIDVLKLKEIQGREVCCYSISSKNQVNIDITLDWLIKHSGGR